jgi:hypothetical protein
MRGPSLMESYMSIQHGIFLDPVPAYIFAALEEAMRVDDQVRKTVVYIGYEAAGGFIPYGTGFLCGTTLEDVCFNFVATAAHVFHRIPGDSIYIRANRNEGGSSVVQINKSRAIFHEKPEVDLVIVNFHFSSDIFDVMHIDVSRDSLQSFGSGWQHGIGDEVCVSGLYTSHFGRIRNIPVIRIGHIASMPEEPVQTNLGYVDGYIIELHSIAGLSGSPVFVSPFPFWWNEDRSAHQVRNNNIPIPFGMLLGHHVIESKEDEIPISEYQSSGSEEPSVLSARNTGFGVVIPLQRITEILERDDIVRVLRQVAEQYRKKSGFVPDG